MLELLCRLQAISSFAKDCHYHFNEYSQHLLADVNEDDLEKQIDLINEVCYLGQGEEAPAKKDILAGALDYIAQPSNDEKENFAKLKLMIKECLVHLEQTEAKTRGANALLDNIAMTLQQLHGLLFKTVDDAKDIEYLNSLPDLMEEENYNSKEDKIAYVMKEFEEGRLKDSHGNIVTDKDQALAIAYSEARKKKLNNSTEEPKDWITVKGNHIPVKDGQTHKQAAEEFVEKKSKLLTEKEKEDYKSVLEKYEQLTKSEKQPLYKYKKITDKAQIEESMKSVIAEDGIVSIPKKLESSSINLDTINITNKVIADVFSKYNQENGYKSYIINPRLSTTVMQAGANTIEINSKYVTMTSDEIKEIHENNQYETQFKKRLERIKNLLADENMKDKWDYLKKEKVDLEKDIEDLKKENVYKRWSVQTSAENYIRDTVYHEIGHTLMFRATRNDKNFVIDLVKETLDKARKNKDIYKISRYANHDIYEFFAESFTMKQTKQDLPEYINEMLEKVIARTNK